MKHLPYTWTRSYFNVLATSLFCFFILLSAVEARGIEFGAIDANRELHCLALNIYFEARNEPEAGKHAVGHVVMNRVAHKRFPQSICRVIRQGGERRRHRCQFSWWCDGQSDRPRDWTAWTESRRIAAVIYTGASQDPTEGALWYHADYVKPKWRYDYRRGPKIGRHVFYAIDNMKQLNVKNSKTGNISIFALPVIGANDKDLKDPAQKNRFEKGREDFNTRLLMIFGIALIGLGLLGFRRRA
jgi:hypothetical protein